MGFLRGLAKGIVGFIFLLLLSVLLMNASMYESTSPEFLKPALVSILSQGLESQNITSTYNDAQEGCISKETYSQQLGDFSITLNCSKVKSSDQSSFSKLLIGELFDQQLYNRECKGLDCLKLQDIPGFATSAFNQFLKISLFIVIGLTLLFGIFLFLLSSGWTSKFTSIGTPFILTGISAIPLEIFRSKIVVADSQALIDRIIDIVLRDMYISLAVGIILIAVGIAFSIKKPVKGGKKKNKK